MVAPRNEIALSAAIFSSSGLPSAQIALISARWLELRLIVDDKVNNGFPTGRATAAARLKRGKQLVTMSLAARAIVPLTDGAHYDNFRSGRRQAI